jgi:Cu/Ag efflux protein CusF
MTHIPVPRSIRERVVIAFVSLGLIIAGVGLLVVLPGCEKSAPTPTPSTPAPAADRGPAAATYTVRGRISALPSAQADLQIEHEPIPDFKDESGKAIGMSTMIMPFPLATGVSLDGIKAGDPVEFEFHVWWKPRVAYEVTRITKLPADTTLTFGRANPAPAAEPAPAPSAPR